MERVAYLLNVLALCCIKLSFLFFYKRCFTTVVKGWFDHVVFGMIVCVIAWSIAVFLATLFACKANIALLWTPPASPKCLKNGYLLLGVSLSDTIVDLGIIILPIPKARDSS